MAAMLLVFMVFGLTACFGAGTPGAPDSSASVNTPGEEKTQKEETAQAVPSKEASSETAEKGSETVPSENTGTEEHKQDKVRQVLIDNDSCRLEWTSFEISENDIYTGQYSHKKTDQKAVNERYKNILYNTFLTQYAQAYNYVNTLPK